MERHWTFWVIYLYGTDEHGKGKIYCIGIMSGFSDLYVATNLIYAFWSVLAFRHTFQSNEMETFVFELPRCDLL